MFQKLDLFLSSGEATQLGPLEGANLNHWTTPVWVWVFCYDQWSVDLGIKPHLGLMTRFLLLSVSCGFVDVGHSLWGEDGCVIYNCCWPLPVQSFSGGTRNHILLPQIWDFLFVISYGSQGYSGSIRPDLRAEKDDPGRAEQSRREQ
jgi:hypothetical protein